MFFTDRFKKPFRPCSFYFQWGVLFISADVLFMGFCSTAVIFMAIAENVGRTA